jgi:beta-glucosidase
MKKTLLLLILITAVSFADEWNVLSFNNSGAQSKSIDARVEALLSRMTVEEKVGQMTITPLVRIWAKPPKPDGLDILKRGAVGAVYGVPANPGEMDEVQKVAIESSRLKIPLIIGGDVIHGYRTVFPVPLAETSSWNLRLAERAAEVAALESAAMGLHWTFAPMVDIARDPRWGRIVEGAGEDPYLGSLMAAARVKGFQGKNYGDRSRVIACAKHFAAYGAAEAGKDYNTVDMSERTLREVHLPPFKAAVDAGVRTFMTAFNDLNGVPASANPFLLKQILRDEWKFDGFVVSDSSSVKQLVQHGFALDDSDAARKAALSGVDMEMSSNATYMIALASLVKNGTVPERVLDQAVRRILRVKFELGLFENPYSDPSKASVMLSPQHRQVAREVARESIVLLKNEKDLLPLSKSLKRIAVIGPLADDNANPLGPWKGGGRAEDVVTALKGIREALPKETVVSYAKGTEINSDSTQGIAEAVKIARESDVVIAVLGESIEMSGEAGSRTSLDLPGVQQQLLEALNETGRPIVLLLMNGRPLTISWAAEKIPAIVETWFLGIECGHAIADVLFGDYNPSGKLPVTFPRDLGQVPLYYSYKSTGRPCRDLTRRTCARYVDLPNTPLYPFGHGLSYTRFKYQNLTVSPKVRKGQAVEVAVEVQNTGTRKGEEVVQLYVQDVVASITRPVQELKGFEKVSLAPGEKRTVRFSLGPDKLGFLDEKMIWTVEPGEFIVRTGGNSVETIEAKFTLTP